MKKQMKEGLIVLTPALVGLVALAILVSQTPTLAALVALAGQALVVAVCLGLVLGRRR